MNSKLPLSEIRACVQASLDSYNPSQVTIKSDTCHVLIRKVGNLIIVSFRGTQGLKDFLTDFRAITVPFGFGKIIARVHLGFLISTRSVIKQVIAALQNGSGAALWITGHSLGGAQATIASTLIIEAGLDVCGVVTFGSPRVGCHLFRDRYSKLLGDRTWRFENYMDGVPLVPTLGLGYRHVVSPEWLAKTAGQLIGAKWWRILDVELMGTLRGEAEELLKDHHCQVYKDKIFALK